MPPGSGLTPKPLSPHSPGPHGLEHRQERGADIWHPAWKIKVQGAEQCQPPPYPTEECEVQGISHSRKSSPPHLRFDGLFASQVDGAQSALSFHPSRCQRSPARGGRVQSFSFQQLLADLSQPQSPRIQQPPWFSEAPRCPEASSCIQLSSLMPRMEVEMGTVGHRGLL